MKQDSIRLHLLTMQQLSLQAKRMLGECLSHSLQQTVLILRQFLINKVPDSFLYPVLTFYQKIRYGKINWFSLRGLHIEAFANYTIENREEEDMLFPVR